jgi:hypothetical protein
VPHATGGTTSAAPIRAEKDHMSEFNTTPQLVLLPAVDVADGKAVRMTQGEVGTEANYGDPV